MEPLELELVPPWDDGITGHTGVLALVLSACCYYLCPLKHLLYSPILASNDTGFLFTAVDIHKSPTDRSLCAAQCPALSASGCPCLGLHPPSAHLESLSS